MMRIATFNIENLDITPDDDRKPSLEIRVPILRAEFELSVLFERTTHIKLYEIRLIYPA